MNPVKSIRPGVLKLYIVYLLTYVLTVTLFYISDIRFKNWIFYTKWGLLYYGLCYIPFLASLIVATRQYTQTKSIINNSGVQFFILLTLSHTVYGISAVGYKTYSYYIASINGELREKDLLSVMVTKPIISLKYNPSTKHNDYVISVSVKNPLPYDVNLKIDSRISNRETLYLVDTEIKANYTEIIRTEVDENTMRRILSNFHSFWLNYVIEERHSSRKISKRASISHELCKWSLAGCPEFGSIFPLHSTYPFNDKLIKKRTYYIRRGVLGELSKDEIEPQQLH
jgi:hypothetical protein